MKRPTIVLKLLGLTILLNLVRYYTLPLVFERLVVFPGLVGAMEEHPEFFRNEFTTFDWVTSYLYNFMMWFVFTSLYYLLHPRLTGGHVLKSLKAYGCFFLLFASISFIYMNHYSHPRAFYLWNVLDAALVMPVVALANGLLFPYFFKKSEEVRA